MRRRSGVIDPSLTFARDPAAAHQSYSSRPSSSSASACAHDPAGAAREAAEAEARAVVVTAAYDSAAPALLPASQLRPPPIELPNPWLRSASRLPWPSATSIGAWLSSASPAQPCRRYARPCRAPHLNLFWDFRWRSTSLDDDLLASWILRMEFRSSPSLEIA